ncbi:class I SAM-dependent methyltransferase [Streptomyces sp. Q6]|uniref:Class I SAM-dependent methyltransferase n=1 Tax=Streptomyces citrinus TaxID=3118173 RepID=A0ACD5A6R6_9ACTN
MTSETSATDRERLRRTFTEDAELYDRMRPGYPPRVYDDLADIAGVGPGCRVLEIGPGTGQATVPLAERGCRVVGVELGAQMAAVARRRLAGHGDTEIHVAAFEEWPLPPEPFDVVLAATAFTWIDPRVRVARAAAALRPGGVLATIATHHIKGGTEDFFAAAQEPYERFDPSTPPGLRLRPAADIPYDSAESGGVRTDLNSAAAPGSDRFEPPVFHRYEWDATYTTDQYLALLCTYSGHRDLAPGPRAGLLAALGRLIDRDHGGTITKRYLTELRTARRRG